MTARDHRDSRRAALNDAPQTVPMSELRELRDFLERRARVNRINAANSERADNYFHSGRAAEAEVVGAYLSRLIRGDSLEALL